jgi:hypothetical protein
MPVDFVIAWTPDGLENYNMRSIKSGGTAQAIDMASRKGIPIINLANPNWKQKLNDALGIKDIEVPDFLYHITALRNKDKILRNGLIPRSNSKKSFHQDRIYLFTDLSKTKILANQFSNYDFNYYELS